jgi:hypothetical protein
MLEKCETVRKFVREDCEKGEAGHETKPCNIVK